MEAIDSPFTKIFKRDGSAVAFDHGRIVEAIFKAAQAVGGKDRDLAAQLAHQVIDRLQTKVAGNRAPGVEEIQDAIEKTLIEAGHARTVKAFILYRQKRKEARETRSSFLAIEKTVDQYLQAQSRPQKTTFRGLLRYTAESILSHYALNKIYPPQISEAHRDGILFIHDLGSAIAGNALVLKRRTNATTPEAALAYLERIKNMAKEWAGRIILEDSEQPLKFLKNSYSYLERESVAAQLFFLTQQAQTLKALLTQASSTLNFPGIIVKGSLLKESAPLPFLPLSEGRTIISNIDKIETASALLGILPAKAAHDLSRINLGVVTLNLNRVAQSTPTQREFFAHLEKHLAIAKHALQIKKKVFEQNFDEGLFPETQSELGLETRGFLSVGFAGFFQAAMRFSREPSKSSSVLEKASEILHFVLDKLQSFQEETLQPFAIDFLTSRSSPFYEDEPELVHEHALEFKELLPLMSLRSKAHEVIQTLSSKAKDFLVWTLPKSPQIKILD